jgi:hypothetical protein
MYIYIHPFNFIHNNIIEYQKPNNFTLEKWIQVFYLIASKHAHKWTWICDKKIGTNVTMGSLRIDSTTMLWIPKQLQRPIHIWNKISKHILMQNGLKIYYPLHIDYSSQYFEQIEYVNGVWLKIRSNLH